MMHVLRHVSILGFLGLAALTLPACESSGEKDFNKMVQGMINNAQNRSPEEVARDLFNTGTPDARRAAIGIIQSKKWGHEPPYMNAYRVLATDPEPLVRGQAYRALGSSHQPGVALDLPPAVAGDHTLPGLITGLSDKDPAVRRDVVAAMCDVHNEAMVDVLIECLRSGRAPRKSTDPPITTEPSDPQLRVLCARALTGYNSPQVLRVLAEALDDQDVAVIQYAYDALKASTNQQFEKAPQPWMEYINAKYPATQPGAS